jgi:hypothetical protein
MPGPTDDPGELVAVAECAAQQRHTGLEMLGSGLDGAQQLLLLGEALVLHGEHDLRGHGLSHLDVGLAIPAGPALGEVDVAVDPLTAEQGHDEQRSAATARMPPDRRAGRRALWAPAARGPRPPEIPQRAWSVYPWSSISDARQPTIGAPWRGQGLADAARFVGAAGVPV